MPVQVMPAKKNPTLLFGMRGWRLRFLPSVRYPLFLLPRSSTGFTISTPLKRIERSMAGDISAFMTFDHVG
jgi:hypothetical protein